MARLDGKESQDATEARGDTPTLTSPGPPPYWHGWPGVVRRLRGGRTPAEQRGLDAVVANLRRQGLDAGPLAVWVPTAGDRVRLEQAQASMAQALNPGHPGARAACAALERQLVGGPHWDLLRALALAYLRGKGRLSGSSEQGGVSRQPGGARQPGRARRAGKSRKPRSRTGPAGSPTRRLPGPLERLREARSTLAVPSVTTFGKDAEDLTIYVDESWPGGLHPEKKDLGVIAGVVWVGRKVDPQVLPLIDTHLRGDAAAGALGRLLSCPRCLPFLMPVRVSDDVAARHYDELVHSALKILLGWLLPAQGPRTRVRVRLEQYGGHRAGQDETGVFRALLSEVGRYNRDRFGRWELADARYVEKDSDEEGYIPYGDLLAYLAMESPLTEDLRAVVDHERLPGYVPLSLDLVPRLEAVDLVDHYENLTEILALLEQIDGIELCRLVVADLGRKASGSEPLTTRLLEALDREYRAKDRDLARLRRIFAQVRQIVGRPPGGASARLRLLWAAVALQDANHDGDPGRIEARVTEYEAQRVEAKQHDRELDAFVAANLAVHHADRFQFMEAERVARSLVDDAHFEALTPLSRGRALSSLGQYLSMQGRHAAAEQQLARALEALAAADLPESVRRAEEDQTAVYRAINALDGGLEGDLDRVRAVTGPLEQAAARLAVDTDRAGAYRHHLLLRCLELRDDVDEARRAYLAGRPRWSTGQQHPWELIEMYRGLLLFDEDEDEDHLAGAMTCFERGIAIAASSPHGAVLWLIAGMIATVATCVCAAEDGEGARFVRLARDELERAGAALPAASPAIDQLLEILDDPAPERVDEALAALPFNYH